MRILLLVFTLIVISSAQESVTELSFIFEAENQESAMKKAIDVFKAGSTDDSSWVYALASKAQYSPQEQNDKKTFSVVVNHKEIFKLLHLIYLDSMKKQELLSQEIEKNKVLRTTFEQQKQTYKAIEEEKNNRIGFLEEQAADYQNVITEKNNSIINFEKKIQNYKAIEEEKNNRIGFLEEQAADYQNVITEKNNSIIDLEKNTNREDKLDKNQQNLSKDGMELLKMKELEIIQQKRIQEKLNIQIQAWQARYNKQQDALLSFSKRMDEAKKQISLSKKLIQKNYRIKSEMEKLVIENKKLREKCESMEDKLHGSTYVEATKLEQKNNKLLELVLRINTELRELWEEYRSLYKNYTEEKNRAVKIQEKNAKLSQKNQVLDEKIKNLRMKYLQLQEKYWRLDIRFHELTDDK